MRVMVICVVLFLMFSLVLTSCVGGNSVEGACKSVAEPLKWECYVEFARATINLTICTLIENPRTKSHCFDEIANLTNRVEICDLIINDSFWSDRCYLTYAKNNNNASVCDKIQHVTKGGGRPWVDEEDEFVGNRDICFRDVAIATSNLELCDDLDSKFERKRCIYTIAIKERDVEICENFISVDRDSCVSKIAKLTNSSELCSKINIDVIKQSCLRGTAGALS